MVSSFFVDASLPLWIIRTMICPYSYESTLNNIRYPDAIEPDSGSYAKIAL